MEIFNVTTFAETPQLRTVVDLFDIANAVATILIGLVGFIISRSVKNRNDRELRGLRPGSFCGCPEGRRPADGHGDALKNHRVKVTLNL